MIEISDNPKDEGLPEKFKEWRPYQKDIIGKIVNSEKKFFVLEAPTGSGKSPVAIAIANALSRDKGLKKTIYLASTKYLQDQLVRDFPYAKVVKGRNNFQCLLEPQYLTAEDCIFEAKGMGARKCPEYSDCPYFVQRDEALKARLAILNYSYYLHARMARLFEDCDLLVMDEAHLAEGQLMSFVSYRFPYSNFKSAQVSFPPDNRDATVEILKSMIPVLDGQIKALEERVSVDEEPGDIKEMNYIKKLRTKVERFLNSYNADWIFHHYVDKENSKRSFVEFKPVWVDKFGSLFWNNVSAEGKILLMSATIGDIGIFCKTLGIPLEAIDTESLPSTFPLKNRPTILTPVGKLSATAICRCGHSKKSHNPGCRGRCRCEKFVYKTTEYGRNRLAMIKKIDEIIENHLIEKNESGVIHTISYKVAKDIYEHSKYRNKMVFPPPGESKEAAFDVFVNSGSAKALISPAFNIGIDLHDDIARWAIVVKCPWPDLADEQVRRRLAENERWYWVAAANYLVQASGRHVRSYEDFGVTYLLDSNFYWFLGEKPDIFPEWFREAVMIKKRKSP